MANMPSQQTAAQIPLLLPNSTFNSRAIEEEQGYDKALHERRQFFNWMIILHLLGIIFELCRLCVTIRRYRQREMRENGAAAIDELRNRLKLEPREGDVLGLGPDVIEGISWDDGRIAEQKNESIT
ncbi:hypothetical protein OCU04_009948 [Sclerotinia nivalis]|uniref:Uncharacterized protein n=1 Tax=Sclerotinia nivalis TaxID=352851 RepID=A0A9X0ADQ1_9HELO|nr:hypothetical protein OCU04_009948 [Sclerotinia nivalis]